MNKILFALSLARKSGKLVSGYERVKTSVLKGESRMVVLAADLSEKTAKRVKYFCEDLAEVYTISLTQHDISRVSGRLSGVFALADENMARLCKKAISQEKGEL